MAGYRLLAQERSPSAEEGRPLGQGHRSFGEEDRLFGEEDRLFGEEDRLFGEVGRSFAEEDRPLGAKQGRSLPPVREAAVSRPVTAAIQHQRPMTTHVRACALSWHCPWNTR